MTEHPEEVRTWDEVDRDPDRLLDELRRGIQRARHQVRTYRGVLEGDVRDDA